MSASKKLVAILVFLASPLIGACGGETGPEPGGPAPVEDSPAGEGSIYD